MKIDTSTVGAKYLGYYAHMALAIPNPANRNHKQLSLMAQSCTLSYFGKANRARVERILDELMKQPRYSG